MLPQELCALADQIKGRKCEFQNVEVKAAQMGNPKTLYDTFSSFSNQTNGGVIVFGIDEKSGYKTVGVYDAQDLQVQVKNAAEQMEPIVRPFFTVAEYEGKTVMEMVRRILGLPAPPKPDDAADAVALALCHARSSTSLLNLEGAQNPCSTI